MAIFNSYVKLPEGKSSVGPQVFKPGIVTQTRWTSHEVFSSGFLSQGLNFKNRLTVDPSNLVMLQEIKYGPFEIGILVQQKNWTHQNEGTCILIQHIRPCWVWYFRKLMFLKSSEFPHHFMALAVPWSNDVMSCEWIDDDPPLYLRRVVEVWPTFVPVAWWLQGILAWPIYFGDN